MNLKGQLEIKTIETANSTSDVIVGASLENHRSVDEVTKQFHGQIKEINIFGVYLSAAQIAEIYLQTLPMIQSLHNNTIVEIIEEDVTAIDILAPKIITNSTNINIDTTNININATDININATSVDNANATSMFTFNTTESYIPIVEETLNQDLNRLTISTWINPDYSSGSAEFAVVSKESSFVLGINNVYAPQKVATFAVFDGVEWTKITGTTQITDWTNLVAVINGTNISLYVNGNLEAQSTLEDSFSISEGDVIPIPAEIAVNESDLIIGAYLNTLRSRITLSNHFSGVIDDVLIYKKALSQAQINDIYTGYLTPLTNNEIPFKSDLLSFTDEVAVFLNNSTKSIYILPLDIDSTVPLDIQSISFADYVTYKVNGPAGDSNNSTIEIMTFSDVVVAIIIPANSIINNNSTIEISDLLSLTDIISTTLNGDNVIELSEILPINAIIINQDNTTEINLEIIPKLTSVKESYLITEEVEFEFEFYNSDVMLVDEKQKIENATDLIANELEQSLKDIENEIDVTTPETNNNSTITDIISNIENLFSIQIAEAAKLGDNDIAKLDINEVKIQVKDLKDKVKELSRNNDLDKEQLKEIKEQLKIVTKQIKSVVKNLEKNNLDDSAQRLDEIIDTIEETAGIEPIQTGEWKDSRNTIVTEIYDPQGNLVNTVTKYEKVMEGKFNLKLSIDSNNKPGIYKIKTIFTVDGQRHETENEFAWGLVSLNTKKSIYKPGDTADFVIVVLDSEGHPVCNANLSMNVTSPSGIIDYLDSNGIVPNEECGLYDAQYITSVNGTYKVDIHATTSGINTNFSTTFDAQEYYEFDIIRTAQSKIDPTINPNLFDVRIDVESFTDADTLELKEKIPAVFDVVTDADIQTIGDTKILTWTKNLIENKTYVEYSYSIPLVFPQLYSLGSLEINSDKFVEARPWFVAADPAPSFTKLYLRNVLASPTPTAGEKSAVLPVVAGVSNGGAFETRSLLPDIGTSETTSTYFDGSTTTHRDSYMSRFSSLPLDAQTIDAGTWTFGYNAIEANVGANAEYELSVYVWRPSNNSVVGYVYDSHTVVGAEGGTSKSGKVGTFSGSSVTAQAGDILVLEVWVHQNTQRSNNDLITFYYDGTTEPTNGSTEASTASYLSAPVGLTFQNGGTRLYFRDVTAPVTPTAGEKSTALPVGTSNLNSGTTETRSLQSKIGTTQQTITIGDGTSTGHTDSYIARFSSYPLAAQTIGAGTWRIGVNAAEANAGANAFFALSVYVWRPSTNSTVGYVYDSDTALSTEFGNNVASTKHGKVITFSGSSVTAQEGDVLVTEIWSHATTARSNVDTLTFYFGGTTLPSSGSTEASTASYIDIPHVLLYSISKTESLGIADSVIASRTRTVSFTESLSLNDGAISYDKSRTKLVFLSGADTAEVGVDIDSTSDVDILWNVQNKTNGFEHTVGTKDIIVPADGVYRVSYGLSITTTGANRYEAISHVNVNGGNSGSCYDSGYARGADSSFDVALKAECLLDLSQGDTVSIAARRESTVTGMNPQLNAASSWFQIQQITNPNVIILHEATGGDTLSTEGGTLDLTWDTEDRKDTPFEHQSGSSDVKVLFDGLYRVSYSVKHSASGSIRTGTGGAIQIQPEGGSFTNATSGWSSAYLRMASGIDEAALAASTILNLKFKRYHQTCLN
ncbi:Putative copper-binding protein, plastocyanin/azurin family protein [Nitrosarchaeum koreense MY1]|uniref:Putative copper-binding protein, plastocyanin/azurin family protein n=2 Tax=Nitrosarchaeum TaxID=1007082 RepID=F9CVA0_9ARCH|nr:Putative copper-binding protein, plastocyanin/azurin family protein [Nitrosarchaeum koreense MY1]